MKAQIDRAEYEDLKITVRALSEVIHIVAHRNGWGYWSIPEVVEMWVGLNPELAEMVPAVRRTFLISRTGGE